MAAEAHNLKVENHQSYVLLELHNLQKGGHFCDVTLQAKDGVVRAHGAVLMAASPYLRNSWMSRGSADEPSQRDHLNFKHIKLSILQCVVDFIYTGELNVTTNSLNDVLEFCSELNLHEAVKVCQDTLKVCQNTSCTKLAINDDHTIAESNTTENRLAFADPELSSQLVSDHYEDSTDAETVVQPEIKVKLKTNKTNRKRSHSALGEQKDREKKRKKKSKKEDGLVKTLKVPKISILFKEKKKRDISGETKPSRRKQLKPEKKPKVKKNMKLTDESIKSAKDSVTADSTIDNKATVKQEVDSDTEETIAQKVTCSKQSEDKLTAILKKDESDILDTSTEETVFPKECHICKEVFKDIKSFSKHVKTHNTKTKSRRSKQEVWPCCVCGRKLTSAVRQACHHYSKHGIPYDESLRLHACDIEGCKYITASGHYLQIHKKGRHGNERPHVCEFCGKGFKLPSALVTHLNIHTNSKIYRCEKCNLTFNQKGGLDVHEKKHHKGQASWTELCHLCSEKFLQKAELSWHMYTVHQIPLPDRYKVYSCELCDYQTIRKNKLERHQDSHNDNRSWTCDNCGKKFVNKSYLNRHMRYHGEKSFKCTFDGCNYACVDNIGLKKHIRLMHTHKNYKPFVCSLCHYKSGLRGNLDKHIRTVHQLDVVTKHTVHLKMKFKGRQSGDILSKDGELVNVVQDHRGEDPRRLQAILDDSDEDDQEDSDGRPVDMVIKDGVAYTTLEKPGDEETNSQDSEQQTTTRQTISQAASFPYVYNGMQYLTPYTMVPLPTQLHQGEMYTTVDPMTLAASKLSEFY